MPWSAHGAQAHLSSPRPAAIREAHRGRRHRAGGGRQGHRGGDRGARGSAEEARPYECGRPERGAASGLPLVLADQRFETNARTAALNPAGSRCRASWPTPGRTTRSAPGMHSCTRSATSRNEDLVSAPNTTRVGLARPLSASQETAGAGAESASGSVRALSRRHCQLDVGEAPVMAGDGVSREFVTLRQQCRSHAPTSPLHVPLRRGARRRRRGYGGAGRDC